MQCVERGVGFPWVSIYSPDCRELAILLPRPPERSYTTLALKQRTKSRLTSLATSLAKQCQLHPGNSSFCDPDMSTKDDETNVIGCALVWSGPR
ncbi:hypothetical protein U0070_011546 [Myodes glareolus]|uniref:Uncharacterized protein n=1 Tax=Myodes glareolus TaxID=447135 RepID=A0AAW0HCD5_MYOGA